MQQVGGSAWAVSVSDAEELALALYVREALTLTVVDPVPSPLVPPVTAADLSMTSKERSSAAADWALWWHACVQGRWNALRETVAPPGPPEPLAALYELLLDPFRVEPTTPLTAGLAAIRVPAREWLTTVYRADGSQSAGDLDYNGMVDVMAAERGRRPHDFHVELQVLPIAGTHAWTIGVDAARSRAYLQLTQDFRPHPDRHRSIILQTLAQII